MGKHNASYFDDTLTRSVNGQKNLSFSLQKHLNDGSPRMNLAKHAQIDFMRNNKYLGGNTFLTD